MSIERKSKRVRVNAEIGAGVVIAVAIGALPAALVGLELAWIVVTGSVSLLLLAPVLAIAQVRGLDADSRQGHLMAHAGRAVPLAITIRSRTAARHVVLEIAPPSHRVAERSGAPRVAVPVARPGDPIDVAVPTRLAERGEWSGLRLRAQSSWPFGLFTATRVIHLDVDVTVLPRIMPRVDPTLRALASKAGAGVDDRRTTPRRGARGLPMEIRPARAGDTARDIAWRSSVRHGRWMAVDRPSSALEREVDVILVTTVHGGQSLRRSSHAFESAVAHCATTIEWLTRLGARVTLDAGDDGQIVDSVRALPHLRRLTLVRRTEPGGQSGPPRTDRRRNDNRLEITFVALSPLDFQRAVEARSTAGEPRPRNTTTSRSTSPASNGALSGGASRSSRALDQALTLGVEAGGRIVAMSGGVQ